MPTETLAHKLGTTTHISPLLMKARRLGLPTGAHLEALAVARGCRYYGGGSLPIVPPVSREKLSDEELAMALLTIAAPYSPQAIRLGAALLGKTGANLATVIRLTQMERSAVVVRHIAEAGHAFEPQNSFWTALLDALPTMLPPKSGVLPHPTRFVAMTGITRHGRGLKTWWIRPAPVTSE